jgi:hypothetical protein
MNTEKKILYNNRVHKIAMMREQKGRLESKIVELDKKIKKLETLNALSIL